MCKTCNDSKAVYAVAYRKMETPQPNVSSFSIETVLIPCPDCNRSKLMTEPAPKQMGWEE